VIFESLEALLESIPAAVYAATTASTITLAGLWLQNRGESARNIQRLDHDALQRDREREMTMRREVYLKAAEAMAHAQEYLAGLANTDVSPQQHEAIIKGVGADLNKVHIVGSMQTVKTIVEANQFFAHAVSDLSIHKFPITRITHEIEFEQMIIDSASARRDEALANMKEMNRSSTNNPKLWDVQNKIFNDEQKDIDEAFAKKEHLQRQLAQHQMDFLKRCAKAGLELGKLVVKANLAIRRELELHLDADEYLNLMRQSHETLGREVDDFHQKMKQTGIPELPKDMSITAVSKNTSGVNANPYPRVANHHALRRLRALSRLNPTEPKLSSVTPINRRGLKDTQARRPEQDHGKQPNH